MADLVQKIKSAVSKRLDPAAGTSQMLERYWDTAFGARSELDWKWFQYDLWYNGNHYARWDKSTQQIISTNPKVDGRPKVTINKIYSTLRGVRSHVLMNDPVAEVTPYNMTDQEVDQANKLNYYMRYLHDHLHLRSQLRASMLHALKYSVGWWQVMWDEAAEKGQGGVVINVVDPYDLYIDPVARLPKEARYMILAVRRSIDDLKQDPKYKDADWDSIKGTDMQAASTLKSRILSYEKGGATFNDGQKDHGSVILKEFWYKEGEKIMLCAMIDKQIVRKPEETGLDRLPFFRLCSDIEPLAMYGQGWCKNLIPLNKMLETNESSIMEYNVVVNKGRYTVPKNAGVRTVTNQHGIFVEHKVGAQFAPQPMQIPQLSQVIETQTQRINTYIEDIGCQHDASRGQSSPNAVSGVAIEALQEGDSTNLSELTENTQEFLEDVYEYVIELLSQKVVTARNVITSTTTGEKVFFKVIGEQADDQLKQQEGVVQIPQKCAVDVKITSDLAFTADGRRAAMKDLAGFPQMVNLPPDVILKAYNIGPIADIIKDMKQQAEVQQQQEMQGEMQQQDQAHQQSMQQSAQQHQQTMEQQGAQQQAQVQQQNAQAAQQQQAEAAKQPQDPGAQQAVAFIKALISHFDSGTPLPKAPAQITPLFIQYLDHFINSPEGQANPDITQILEQVKIHATMQLGGNQAQAN